jgi:hypothetical protein
MAADAQLLIVFGALHLVGIVLAAVLFTMLLRADATAPPSPPGEGEDGGDDGGRRPEPPAPAPPSGGLGIPLLHSRPARVRLREPVRLADLLPARARRPVRDPEPRRAPAPPPRPSI